MIQKVKHLLFLFMGIILLALFMPMTANAATNDSACVTEAKNYYKTYNENLDIKFCCDKYDPGCQEEALKYTYSVTYVKKNGDVRILLLNEIPHSFGLWNTDIVINEGRVVVTGVTGDQENTWNLIFKKYHWFITGIAGLGTITCILGFIITFMRMGATAGSPAERSKSIQMLLFTGAGTCGLGAVTIIFGFFWNVI